MVVQSMLKRIWKGGCQCYGDCGKDEGDVESLKVLWRGLKVVLDERYVD